MDDRLPRRSSRYRPLAWIYGAGVLSYIGSAIPGYWLTVADEITKFIVRSIQGNVKVAISSYAMGGSENSPVHRTDAGTWECSNQGIGNYQDMTTGFAAAPGIMVYHLRRSGVCVTGEPNGEIAVQAKRPLSPDSEQALDNDRIPAPWMYGQTTAAGYDDGNESMRITKGHDEHEAPREINGDRRR